MNLYKSTWLLFVFCLGISPMFGQQSHSAKQSKLDLSDDGSCITINVENELFCKFEYKKYAKPIIYPIQLKPSLPMTRNFPMQKVAGEANDHPHHMSLWLGHIISGTDFWLGTSGQIEFQKIESLDSDSNRFAVLNHWNKKSDGATLVTERTVYHFGADTDSRWIYADITFEAKQDVVFDDTKEGLFAIRTHPDLRLSPDPKRGVKTVNGQATNDSGTTGKAIWGQPAKWVDYYGSIQGQAAGISLFDHPDNYKHPTTWHAREYGLIAANPFGLHYFAKAPKGAGAFPVKKGEKLNLKYAVRFYLGGFDKTKTENAFQDFASAFLQKK